MKESFLFTLLIACSLEEKQDSQVEKLTRNCLFWVSLPIGLSFERVICIERFSASFSIKNPFPHSNIPFT